MEELRQQNVLLQQQVNHLLKATNTQFPSSSHQLNEEDDEDGEEGEDDYYPTY